MPELLKTREATILKREVVPILKKPILPENSDTAEIKSKLDKIISLLEPKT